MADGQIMTSQSVWRVGNHSSRLLLDVAADRPVTLASELDEEDVKLAHEHGLIGLMADSPDSWLRRSAFPAFVRWSTRQQVMTGQLRRLLSSLSGAGIPVTVLKGPYLAEFVYRKPTHRTFTDIDLLVPRADIDRALEVVRDDPAVASIPRKKPKADKREVPVTDRTTGITFNLDVHWDLFSYTQLQGCAAGATEEAWKQARGPVDTALGLIWHLPEAARLAFLCTHALLDHRFRLVLFRDLAEIAHRSVDWEDLMAFAARWGLRSTTYVSLLIAARATDAPVPAGVLSELRPSNVVVRAIERMLPRTDLVRFDGHQPHALNLAVVLLHDDFLKRATLVARAPAAFPHWRRRVALGTPSRRSRPDGRSVAILVTTDRLRGAEVFGERLAEALRKRGWQATLIALSHDPAGPRVDAQVVSDRSPERLGRLDLQVVRGLRRALKEMRTRILLANGSATLQYALVAAQTLRPPIQVVYSSIGEPLYWIRGGGRRFIQRALLSQADLVLAVSESTKRQLVEGVGLSDISVAMAPTGVPDSFFEIARSPSAGTDLRLLFLGNLSREKNPMAAIELAHRLSQMMAVQLRFVGEGPLQGALQTRAELLDLKSSVGFTGSVEDVGAHLAWADLLILTSETEGLPGVVLEAAAAGVPAVAFEVGGTAETILPGVTGELVPPGNIDELSSTVAKLVGDRTRLIEMGQRAKAFVAERYSLERAVDRYEQILTEQLALNARRPQSARLTS
jgi:glycosyltransferase involved in cell wall biosynthesis